MEKGLATRSEETRARGREGERAGRRTERSKIQGSVAVKGGLIMNKLVSDRRTDALLGEFELGDGSRGLVAGAI
jgi:hypothetical protein